MDAGMYGLLIVWSVFFMYQFTEWRKHKKGMKLLHEGVDRFIDRKYPALEERLLEAADKSLQETVANYLIESKVVTGPIGGSRSVHFRFIPKEDSNAQD